MQTLDRSFVVSETSISPIDFLVQCFNTLDTYVPKLAHATPLQNELCDHEIADVEFLTTRETSWELRVCAYTSN